MPNKLKINWRYTIGEFLIVVLGIITAFQLDAWKERSDTNALYLEYLKDLDVGLQTDSLYYEYANNYFKTINKKIDSTKSVLATGKYRLNVYSQKSIRELTDWYRAYISNSVFEELNNSGRLNVIKNKDLRHNLISYYQYIDFVKLQDRSINQSLARMKENLLVKIDFQDTDLLEISEQSVFQINNYINQKQAYINGYLGHRSTCNQINIEIRNQIRTILRNN